MSLRSCQTLVFFALLPRVRVETFKEVRAYKVPWPWCRCARPANRSGGPAVKASFIMIVVKHRASSRYAFGIGLHQEAAVSNLTPTASSSLTTSLVFVRELFFSTPSWYGAVGSLVRYHYSPFLPTQYL